MEIEHWLADEPVEAWAEPWTVKGRRWVGKHRTLVTAAAVALVVGGAFVVTDSGGLTPGLRDSVYGAISAQKQQLGPGRVIYFIALAYALSQSLWLRRLAECGAGADLRRLGRHSLEIFGFGSLLAAIGQALLPLAGRWGSAPLVESLSMLYTLASLIVLVLLARYIEWDKGYTGARAKFAPGALLGAPRALAQSLRLAFARPSGLASRPSH